MIQDINPRQYHVEYKSTKPTDADFILIFHENDIIMETRGKELYLPTLSDIRKYLTIPFDNLVYLFSIDNKNFYLLPDYKVDVFQPLSYENAKIFRTFSPSWKAFAGITACQLNRWYSTHKFCGKCGTLMTHSDKERALCCNNCQITEYPKISPAVILGITDGNRILLTKYSGRSYTDYALIAGFTEIGESFEDTVRREAMEEVGLKVKNIRYYKSQPWAFTDTILAGFFAEVDGDIAIDLDTNELSEARWFERETLPEGGSPISLTHEMIELFRRGN